MDEVAEYGIEIGKVGVGIGVGARIENGSAESKLRVGKDGDIGLGRGTGEVGIEGMEIGSAPRGTDGQRLSSSLIAHPGGRQDGCEKSKQAAIGSAVSGSVS